ncbi:MAG: peroxiredoxin [Deltaproteobacteria bacterium]|nr:peroxiredoxin [Deltaproteobacteria bacterium]
MKHRCQFQIAWALLLLCAAGCGPVQRPDGGSGLLAVGSAAPGLVANDHLDRPVDLRAAKISVVYFYPRDGTPGCTKEACAFRDVWQRYESAHVRVIGVSTNAAQEHREFAITHKLSFSLIADSQGVWSKAFGVPRLFGMTKRVSFLLDAHGSVAKVYSDVDPGVHANQVLRDVAALTREPAR